MNAVGKKSNGIFVRDVRGELVGELRALTVVVSVENFISSERNLSSVTQELV